MAIVVLLRAFLWTCAHHRIPILNVMFNNRAYHEELNANIQRMATGTTRECSGDTIKVGTGVRRIRLSSFSKIAQGMGMYAEGPIENPGRSCSGDSPPHWRRQSAVSRR